MTTNNQKTKETHGQKKKEKLEQDRLSIVQLNDVMATPPAVCLITESQTKQNGGFLFPYHRTEKACEEFAMS